MFVLTREGVRLLGDKLQGVSTELNICTLIRTLDKMELELKSQATEPKSADPEPETKSAYQTDDKTEINPDGSKKGQMQRRYTEEALSKGVVTHSIRGELVTTSLRIAEFLRRPHLKVVRACADCVDSIPAGSLRKTVCTDDAGHAHAGYTASTLNLTS